METKDKRPAMPEHERGEISCVVQYKDKPKLSNRQKRVYELLLSGKHSATDITIKLGYCDPRSYIAILRRKGISIADIWVQRNDVRFKKYFVK